jgi:hypothetical protein
MVSFRQPTSDPQLQAEAERIHHAWNDALATRDADAITALYAKDATIESPLVRYLLGTDEGVCAGREAIRAFIPLVFKHQPTERRTHRNPVYTDGRTMMWEYPRDAGGRPDGLHRGHGAQGRPDPASPRLLGLVWRSYPYKWQSQPLTTVSGGRPLMAQLGHR